MKISTIKHNVVTLTFSVVILSGLIYSCSGNQPKQKIVDTTNIKKVKPIVIKKIPHDPTAFTQGLFYDKGKLYESTGLNGKSTIRIVDTLGRIEKSRNVPNVFAEGCALLKQTLYQITWQEQVCIMYSFPSLEITGTINYKGEGWGLTGDGIYLYMSNGSDTITIRNEKFKIQRKIPVRLNGKPLININELEFVQGKIYANVWFSDYIFLINVANGFVERIVNCSELVAIENPSGSQNVLNGIAFNASSGVFYITGKNWKNMFIVKIPK